MRKAFGLICMLLGVALLCGSGGLFLHNRNEEAEAAAVAQAVLPHIIEKIPEKPAEEVLIQQMIPVEFLEPEDFTMTEVEIDGELYIGYLSIPALELELPVMSGWNDQGLRKATCRYAGTLRGDDLVIMAHRYRGYFRNLPDLNDGDQVIFTDMDGVVTTYEVISRDVVPPSAVEEVTAGYHDLTLFTCTYDAQDRFVIYCDKV